MGKLQNKPTRRGATIMVRLLIASVMVVVQLVLATEKTVQQRVDEDVKFWAPKHLHLSNIQLMWSETTDRYGDIRLDSCARMRPAGTPFFA